MTSGRMLPSERLDVEVEVFVSGTWWPGFLEHRRQAGDQWEGFVRWSSGPGQNRIGWFHYDDLRATQEPPPARTEPGVVVCEIR